MRWRLVGLSLLAAFVAAAILLWPASIPSATPAQLRLQARELLKQSKWVEAERFCVAGLERFPDDASLLLVAGEAAFRREDFNAAITFYDRVMTRDPATQFLATLAAAETERHLGRLQAAERRFRRARLLAREPGQLAQVDERLAFVLNVSGQRWAAASVQREMVERGQLTTSVLVQLGDLEPGAAEPEFLKRAARDNPDDPLPRIGLARLAVIDGDWSGVEAHLRGVRFADEAHVELLICRAAICLAKNDAIGFEAVRRAMADEGEGHPDWWSLCGRWSVFQGRHDEAVRCFAEALRLNPESRTATYGLGIALSSLHREVEAKPFLDRAERLAQLSVIFGRLDEDRANVDLMHGAAELVASLDRTVEAAAWARLALHHDPHCNWAASLLAELQVKLASSRRAENAITALNGLDWKSFPRPKAVEAIVAREPVSKRSSAQVRFSDDAAALGLDFVYDNGHEKGTSGMRMYEFTGGGVAVIDFDGDDLPDLYWTQGGRLQSQSEAARAEDSLCRNLGDRFVTVTSSAGLRDADYGQGVAAGDFNDDGFADLYVANIGRNRLLQNNGDGTFQDVTDAAGLSGELWTTSCAMADLNGDGWADLFDCTYLSGEDALRRMCQRDGQSRACDPGGFDAEADRVWLSLGDGQFVDATRDVGGTAPNGKGLGVVIGSLDDSPGLDIFVANDAVANHFFAGSNCVPRTRDQRRDSSVKSLKFEERGLVSGLAFDGDGRAQACMGVAAGDADGDGQLDLFVTNFHREPNTLYRQSSPGFFQDWTRRADLYEPSFLMLGFGTQFLDADLDGRLDLVVANGHVDDFSHKGIPFQMPPQFFANTGDSRFVEQHAPELGDYFAGRYLGRGLATLDWNRDGRPDVAVTHLDRPVALLTNRTRESGHVLTVSLRGTHSARDAIGARIEIVIAGRSHFRDLTAGDGYQASNQRQVSFGLGDSTKVERMIVQWPSGASQAVRVPRVDCELRVVEGRPEAVVLELPSPF